MLERYLADLTETARRGDAREESFYGGLSDLLGRFAGDSGRGDMRITTLPRPTEGGSPDFRVWDGRQHVTGYIEAKHPRTGDLDRVAESEQLRRYRGTFPNLILTNFLEFRLYRGGEPVDRVLAARPFVLHDLDAVPPPADPDGLRELLETFLSFSLPRSYDAESLARALARRTRFLRRVVGEELDEERAAGSGNLLGFYEAFQQYLIARLEPGDFADLYAQTVTYGLFAARTRATDDFRRRTASDHIPQTIGILRELFEYISYGEIPEQLEWIVDDIAEVLGVADAGGILDRFYREGKGSDPVVHFYETFLASYDPEERERRGVYYTPEAVVSYIVRSLHGILKDRFGKADGLASGGVTLLDPAAGTMTFVARACQEAVGEFERKYGGGGRESFVRDHLLENFHAFELMMAPYAVGHLKMSFLLEELGHRLQSDERFRFYLTNTLEMEELDQTNFPGLRSLAEESHLAGEVKRERPILVILGNPPYSGHSANRGEWISGLIEDYKQVNGEPLGERNPKWLQDDYVKFLRFAQWKIDRAGEGVVGMITNHSWLDNPTFRGMRRSLMQTFDEIRVLDLHGNSLKKERAPGGGPDENVFDIRQGVAISFFIKRAEEADAKREAAEADAGSETAGDSGIHHAERWGTREEKYGWLEESDFATTDWERVRPRSEFYLYLPRDEAALDRYREFPRVTEIFPVHSVGIVTSRDGFVIDFDRRVLERRIRMFRDSSMSDEMIREALGLRDNRDWKLSEKRKRIQRDEAWREKFARCLYRPFDERWIFYHYDAIDFGREEVMRHMLRDNAALITPKQHKGDFGAYTTTGIGTHKTVAVYDINYYFPLYLYPDSSKRDLFAAVEGDGERTPNLHRRLRPALGNAYGERPSPESILHYVYAVLYAHGYREKYAEFLKIDFPRIPFAQDPERFGALAGLGGRLVDLHLLRADELDPPAARFQGEGENRVARTKRTGFRYEDREERVHINPDQHFGPVPPELWEYRIGGYQVLHKWLKDRRERPLTTDEIRTYCRIVTALGRTIELQEEIDALYPDAEAEVVELNLGE